MKPRAEGWLVALTIVVLGALLLPDVRHGLEGDMARHMLVEFALLILAGYGFATALPAASIAVLSRFDQLGVSGLTLATSTLAVWMIPAALDATLADPAAAMAKYLTLVATGFALRGIDRRAPLPLQSFFVLGLAWMMATVGLIYQESPQQLCLYYPTDAQERAGRGLVIVAALGTGLWCVHALRELARRSPRRPGARSRPTNAS